MYRCYLCRSSVAPRTPAHRVPLALRVRHYPPRPDAHIVYRNGKAVCIDDPGGVGTEIVCEVIVCPACAAHHQPSVLPAQPLEEGVAPLAKANRRDEQQHP
jgi:hypothetical protein